MLSPLGERPKCLPALRFLKLLGPQTAPRCCGAHYRGGSHRGKESAGAKHAARAKEPGGLWGRGRGREPPAWISGPIQCLQKERTRSHHSNLEPLPPPPGKPQVPGRKQVPTGFILPPSLFRVRRLSGEEGGRSSSSVGVGEGGEGGEPGPEPGELPDSPGPAPFIWPPGEFSDSSTVTESVAVAQPGHRSPRLGPCKHTTQLLPDGTVLQAPSLAPSPFRKPPAGNEKRRRTGLEPGDPVSRAHSDTNSCVILGEFLSLSLSGPQFPHQ